MITLLLKKDNISIQKYKYNNKYINNTRIWGNTSNGNPNGNPNGNTSNDNTSSGNTMMRQAFIRQVTIKQNNNDKIKKETNMYPGRMFCRANSIKIVVNSLT